MYASSFSPPSNREIKKNIVPFEENATDLIMNTQIYNYQYDNELDGELPHTGIIVDEAPVWTVDPRGKGVDLYAMVSLAWKSNQELAQRVTDLENRLLALESK
jgi:hypothetical protein